MADYKYEIYTCKNSKASDKQNEDFVLYDGKEGVGLILDGVSRDRENGIYPSPSPAFRASKIFADSVLEKGEDDSAKGILKIQNKIRRANLELKKYNAQLGHRFPAGTVGLVFSFERGCFHYGYIGDCYAAIIRDGSYRVFTECQTMMVAQHKKEFTSDQIRFDICNHISHPCGYGVWDGNENAMDFVKYGTIQIRKGDVIFMFTDGLLAEVSEKSTAELVNCPLEQLFLRDSDVRRDDRTCIRISCRSGMQDDVI